MKKILSALLAIMMLGQTVFAQNLKDYISSNTVMESTCVKNGIFDYQTFIQSANLIDSTNRPEIIPTKVTTTVKVHNEGTYSEHGTGNALNSGDPAKNAFDYKAELDMSNVKSAFNMLYNAAFRLIDEDASVTDKDTMKNQFKNSKVEGTFTVTVEYDPNLTLSLAPEYKLMQNGSDSVLFTQATPTFDTTDPSLHKAIFVFGIDHTNGDITVQTLKDHMDTYFSNLYMEIKNVTATVKDSDLKVQVYMNSAFTEFFDTGVKYGIINYKSNKGADPDAAVVRVPSTVPTPPSGGGSSVAPPRAFTVVEDIKTPVTVKKEAGKYYVNVDEIEKPSKDGYVFDGWYLDVGYTNPVSGTIQIKRSTYLYGRYIPVDDAAPKAYKVIEGETSQIPVTSEEDGSYTVDIDGLPVPEKPGFVFNGWYLDPYYTEPATGTVSITEDTYLYAQFINTSAPSHLISDEHILYIVGYPDGEVKPNGLITREEVAAAFYRLLKPEYRATIETTTHSFPDVASTRWSNEEIATLANGGYIVGDEKGNFNPAKPITRAEFVTIATKFAEKTELPETNIFTDITGHWAEEYILRATNDQHWISGYEDHTFRPNNSITRAEAMTIINKMLVRYGDVTSDHAMQWPDVSKTDWYYSNVIEATTEHNFTRNADGWNETWTFGTGVDDEVIESVSGSHITE